jgi:glycosyltransferase involved in cell wall biosynthesis
MIHIFSPYRGPSPRNIPHHFDREIPMKYADMAQYISAPKLNDQENRRCRIMKQALPLVTAIIPSKNRPQRVAALIENLRSQDFPQDHLEILLIDDGSTPPYRSNGSNLTLIRHDRSQGAQKSRNEGIKKASGAFVLMLDDDIELLQPDFISRAVIILNQWEKVAAVFARQIALFHNNGSSTTKYFPMTRPSWYSGELVPYSAPEGPIAWGNQVFLARREVLKQIGGYDGIYGLNGGHSFREESDVHARLRRQGYQLWFLPELSFHHHIDSTGGHGPNSARKLYWVAHNHIVFIRRHLRLWPLRALGFLFEIARYSWLQGRCRYIFDMFHGYLAGWRNALRDRGPGRNLWLE